MILDMIPAIQSGHPGVDRWNDLFNEIAPKFTVPPNLLKATVLYESGGDPNVISFDDGCGLGQITSGVNVVGNGQNTQYLYNGLNILDPAYNLTVACEFFIKKNIQAFPDNLDAIVGAYNAGIGAIQNALLQGRELTTVTYAPWYIPAVTGAFNWFCAQAHKAKT